MKYFLFIMLSLTSLVFCKDECYNEYTFDKQNRIEHNYLHVLDIHHEWQKLHKHENLTLEYYWRMGYLEACQMCMDILNERDVN